jgi:aerobic-type carbon monoxide dehydrogenase small subunit (CoxS/CutS family)
MKYSRRQFLKAAGTSAVVMTTVGGCAERSAVVTMSAPQSGVTPSGVGPITAETATFIVNGRSYEAEYDVRTTLWEVLVVKLGLTGTNRSCNRASCGACSVLVDGVPYYACHTLAMEAAGRDIFTIEGLGTEENLHPLQEVGYRYVAADCGFCTPGWTVTAKALLDENRNPTEADVKAALAGHICRCAAYPAIVRTVVDTARVMRGEAEL